MLKLLKFKSWSLIGIWILVFGAFILLPQVAEAGLILNNPVYIGLNSGLVGYWSFDGPDMAGDTALDRSNQGNDGTLTNGPKRTAGRIGQALDFDGVDDKVNAGSATLLDDLGPMTVSAWIKPNSLGEGSDGSIMAKSNAGNTAGEWRIRIISSNRLRFFRKSSIAPDQVRTSSADSVTMGEWQHVVMTWDGSANSSNVHFYRNGVELSYETTTDGGADDSDAAFNLIIGNRDNDTKTFDGLIDEVRVYNRALSADEIKRLYRIGATLKLNVTLSDGLTEGLVGHWTFDGPDVAGVTAFDRSGQGNDGTLTNGPQRAAGRVGQALEFDGSNDYVAAGNVSNSAKTVSFWIKPDSTTEKILDLNGGTDTVEISSGTLTLTGFGSADIAVNATSSNPAGAATSATFSHTTSGSNRLLIVAVYEISIVGVSSITYDSVNLTKIRSDDNGSNSRTELWYLVAPATGANNIVVTMNGSATFGVGAISFTGVGQTSPIDANTGSAPNVNETSVSDDITTVADNALVVDVAGIKARAFLTAGTGQTSQVELEDVNPSFGLSTEGPKTPAGTVTMSWTADTGNKWAHSVASLKPASGGEATTYINGVEGSTLSASEWQHVVVTTDGALNASAVDIGRISATHLNGLIDDVRIYDRVLSPNEIKRLYRIGATLKINVSPRDQLTDGLVGYWTFDGPDMAGNTAYDRSGQGNNGTLTNGPVRTAGRIGQGLEFDGSDDEVNAGSAASFDNLGPMTVSAWVKPDTAGEGAEGRIVAQDDTAGTGGWNFFINGSAVEFLSVGEDADLRRVTSNGTVSLGEWQHFLLVWESISTDATLVHIYKNGVEQSYQITQNGANLRTDLTNAKNIVIGNIDDGSRTFDGLIDDVRIYDRALSSDEIKRLYNMGR